MCVDIQTDRGGLPPNQHTEPANHPESTESMEQKVKGIAEEKFASAAVISSSDSDHGAYKSRRIQNHIEIGGFTGLLIGSIGFVGGAAIGVPCMAFGAIVGAGVGAALYRT